MRLCAFMKESGGIWEEPWRLLFDLWGLVLSMTAEGTEYDALCLPSFLWCCDGDGYGVWRGGRKACVMRKRGIFDGYPESASLFCGDMGTIV